MGNETNSVKLPRFNDVRRALSKKLCFGVTRIDYGTRLAKSGPRKYVGDVRQWQRGADLFDVRPFNLTTLRDEWTSEGLALDLYVYSGIGDHLEFETNVLLLIAASGEVLWFDERGGDAREWLQEVA